MRKLLASGLALCTFGALAQHDIEVTLNSPASGASATGVANFTISYTITNNGPDVIPAGDTLYITVITATDNYSLPGVSGAVSLVVLPTAIPVGAPLPSATLGLNATMNLSSTSGPVCVFAGIGSISLTADGNPDDSDMDNNADCFNSVPASAGIDANQTLNVVAYPNPATNNLQIAVEGDEVATISIITLDGKVLSTNQGSVVQIQSLMNGLYFYEAIMASGAVIRNSFVKN